MPIRIAPNGIGTKRPASRDRSEGAVRQTHHRREIERLPRQTKAFNTQVSRKVKPLGDRTPAKEFEQIFSSRCNRTGGKQMLLAANLFTNDFFLTSTRHPSSRKKWWSRTGSNRRHPACKAGALPAELRPLITFVSKGSGGPGRT